MLQHFPNERVKSYIYPPTYSNGLNFTASINMHQSASSKDIL